MSPKARPQQGSCAGVAEEFVVKVSHGLRSPLNGIKSWTHVLENQLGESDDPTLRRAIDGIKFGIEQQVRLIEGLDMEVAMLASTIRQEIEAERDKNAHDEDSRAPAREENPPLIR